MQFQPGILSLINSAAQQHGVDPNALQRIAWLESRGNPAAKNANSSASGLFQFINSTAKQYGLNDPFDAAASADAGARFARDNARHLRNRLGRDPSAGELYLAHQQGPGGAVKLLSNPNARAVDVVGADAVRLNGGNENMTAGEFANLWINKAGGTANTFAGGEYTPPENPQPIGGSTMQQGLLNMIQQEDTRTLGQRVKDGAKDGSLWDALAVGFNTMRGPMADQGLAQSVGARMEQRQQAQQRNQTAEWLAANGRQDLAEALINGMINGDQAFAAMQPQQIEGKVVGDRLVNPYTGEVIGDYTTEQQFQTLTGEQAAAMGLDPAQAYNLGPDGRITQIGGGGTNVSVNVGGEGAPELGKLSSDYGYVLDPETRQPIIDPATGLPTAAPVPGSPAARELQQADQQSETRSTQAANAANVVVQDIDKAIGQVSAWTAGAGSVLANIPGSGARDLQASLDTVRANIGFDRLQQMRDASPTGGALGGIAIQELQMLQAVLGSLDTAQSPEQLKANLERLKQVYEPIAAKAAAYPNAAEFGFGGASAASSAAPDSLSDDDLLRKYGG